MLNGLCQVIPGGVMGARNILMYTTLQLAWWKGGVGIPVVEAGFPSTLHFAHMWLPSFFSSYFFFYWEHRFPSFSTEGELKKIFGQIITYRWLPAKVHFNVLPQRARHLCSIDKPFRYKYQMIVAWNLLTLFFPQKFMLGILQWSMNMIQGPCHMEMKWLSPILPNYCRKERHLVTDFKVLTLCCALWCRIQIAKWNSW